MRNSTIVLTAIIAVLAGGLAWSVSRPQQVQGFLNKGTQTSQVAETDVTGNVTEAPDAPPPAPTPVADATPADQNTSPPVADTTPVTAPAEAQTADVTPTTDAASTTAPTTTAETDNGGMTPANLDQASARLNGETPAAGDTAAATPDSTTSEDSFKVDVDAAMADRSIGSPAAPITVYDFSSLTCPHCAMFHNEILPLVKTQYIDTGKVRWVFKGFPLNEPALKADMLARCAPDNQFLTLEDMMYKNQQRWAFTDDPIANLSLLVRISGITEKMFLDCVNNKELEDKLAAAIQDNAGKYGINSTPTFVLNDGKKKIVGAGTFAGFSLDLDTMLKELGVEPPAHPATTEPPLLSQ